jgi:ABC-type uncharacterized transport system ATPase subunit
MPGEIHAVLGENGAGKSTLMKIIYGAVKPDAGRCVFDGRRGADPQPATKRAQLGIAMVFQHFSLFETLSVAENVMARAGAHQSRWPRSPGASADQGDAEYGLDIDPAAARCTRLAWARCSGSRSSARCWPSRAC